MIQQVSDSVGQMLGGLAKKTVCILSYTGTVCIPSAESRPAHQELLDDCNHTKSPVLNIISDSSLIMVTVDDVHHSVDASRRY